MTEHEDSKREELRERWIESLLVSATGRQDHTDRIARAMGRLEAQKVTPQAADPVRIQASFLQWGSIGMAATVLFALFLWIQAGGSQSAMAAIERSLNVAAQPMTRKYLVQVESQTLIGGTRETDIDLYVHGEHRFALRHPGPLSLGTVWVGQDGADSWVVPPIGPVLKGGSTSLDRWIRHREDLNHIAELHITTVMRRMISRGYRLEMLADEEITVSDGLSVECQHIRAERETTDQQDSPDAIELWISHESAMAVRIVAQWERKDGEVGRKSAVLTFQSEEPSLVADWYTAEAHYRGDRPVISLDPLASEP